MSPILTSSLLLAALLAQTATGAATRHVYNSSDLSYLSNGIQFPVPPEAESQLSSGAELHTPPASEMQWLARLFDHAKWRMGAEPTGRCRAELTTYLEELANGTAWAAKMYDASGRYAGQFFFGNDYWLGSKTLCKELVPPFPVRFYMAKIRLHINGNFTPVTRQLNVGQCLPASCDVTDVRNLLARDRKSGSNLNIVGVRPVPGDYNIFTDPKFQALAGICLIVGLLIIASSFLDYFLSSRQAKTSENNNNNDDEENKKKTPRPSALLRALLSFSALTNTQKIFDVEHISEDSIRCIHGMRFFSIGWIILVHTYLEVFSIADNKSVRVLTERSFMYQTIANATFSVDTFFFISGLLVTLTFFRQAAKKQKKEEPFQSLKSGVIKFFFLIIYRFFRLTPAYLFVLGANEIIMRFLHSFSVFSPAIIDHISCSAFWWRNALYINNFYPQTEFCMLWSWYIANDTQFYLLAIILLLIAVRGNRLFKLAATALGVFMAASWIITFIIALKYEYTIRVEEPFALFDQLYDKPWMRVGPYFIGMICGYFMFRVDKVKLAPLTVIAGWLLSILCVSSLVYGVGRTGLVVPASAFYAALGHTAWGLSLAWMTVACCWGYGGPASALLNFKLFLPLSRLAYCAYLVHPVLMCLTSFVIDGPIHLNEAFVVVIFCGNVVLSFTAAFAISIFFEAPVVNLLKIIFH